VSSLDPAAEMIAKGVTPLEPYPGSNKPWKCKCIACGAIVHPRYYTVVKREKGGCNFCAKKNAGIERSRRIREEDFPRACADAGVTPLSEFVNSFEKIELRCNTCGYEFKLVWSPLRDGRGCPKCSRINQSNRGHKKSEAIAIQLFLDANVKPIGPFAGLAKPYPGICLNCGSEVKPTPSALQQGQGPCFKCGKIKGARKRRESTYSREEALAIMASRDIQISPGEPYPGATKPWPGNCALCGLPVASTVGNARNGKGGCRVCHSLDSDSAFDFFGPGVLYLISSERFAAYKIGIAGKTTSRLIAHKSAGWDSVIFTHDALGYEVNYVEQFVLHWLREEMDVSEAVSNDLLPEGGGTETWAHGTVAPEIVWKKALEQFELKNWPIPIAIQQGTAKKKARRTCTLIENDEQCLKLYYSNGYCRKHYTAWKASGDPLLVKRVPFTNTHCQVIDDGKVCNKPAKKSSMKSIDGMCMTHYHRNYEHGDPTFTKRPTPKPRLGTCSIQSCRKVDFSLGLCKTHYDEARRKMKRAAEGRPEPIKYESEDCEVDGCIRRRSSKGMCNLHYTRSKKYGSPHFSGRGPRMMEKLGHCLAEGCDAPDAQKGLCKSHYNREYKRKKRGKPSLLDIQND
jgi:hypothetical protein